MLRKELWLHALIIFALQLHDRFDALKKKHAEEKKKIEDNKTRYEADMQAFQQRKAQHQAQMSTLGKKGKKWNSVISDLTFTDWMSSAPIEMKTMFLEFGISWSFLFSFALQKGPNFFVVAELT